MRVRRFNGTTTQAAVEQVKAALGPDAVILETREYEGVVTITAATDADEPPPAPGPTRDDDLGVAVADHFRDRAGLPAPDQAVFDEIP